MQKNHSYKKRLTTEIADAIMEYLDAEGAMVVIEAEHTCMTMRGVKKPGAKTVTTTYRGVFKENIDLRREVMNFIK